MQNLFDRVQQTMLYYHILDIDQLLAKKANSKPKFSNNESAKIHALRDMHSLHHSTISLSTIPNDMQNERAEAARIEPLVPNH